MNNRRLALDSIMLLFWTDRSVYVNAVHVWDANTILKRYDGLRLSGSHWFERFDVLNNRVRYGIGVSVGVSFGAGDDRHRVLFGSCGGRLPVLEEAYLHEGSLPGRRLSARVDHGAGKAGLERVILELIVAANLSGAPLLSEIAERYPSLSLDDTYEPVEITPRDEERMRLGDQRKVVVVRGDDSAGCHG